MLAHVDATVLGTHIFLGIRLSWVGPPVPIYNVEISHTIDTKARETSTASWYNHHPTKIQYQQ